MEQGDDGSCVEMGEELVMRDWDGHVYARNRIVVFKEVLDCSLNEKNVFFLYNQSFR